MAKAIKKVCLITPGHISTNPRLVKEATALIEAGYKVHIVFTQYMDYLLKDDLLLLKNSPSITYDNLIWTKNYPFLRFSTGLFQKLCSSLSSIFKYNLICHKVVLNRNYLWQLKQAIAYKADLYIAHNAGAIAVAADAAKKNATHFGFDAEDYHRGEDLSSQLINSLIYIENTYLTEARYITAAAPLIAKAYEKLYNKNVTTVLNVFPTPKLPIHKKTEGTTLKLFWFSQTIGKGRGIEDAIKAIGILKKDHISLTLLGNIDEVNRAYFFNLVNDIGLGKNQLIFIKPIAPDSIFELANHYDIGLALEQAIPLNRDICLTNKIFTYLTSALAVIASETTAQRDFIIENPLVGKSYPIGNINALSKIIDSYDKNRELLYMTKLSAQHLAEEKFNWEKESEKFLQIIGKTLAN